MSAGKHQIRAKAGIGDMLTTNLKVKYSVILADVPNWIQDS